MKAVVQNAYGSSEVLKVKEVDDPVIKESEMLVRVKAASVNAGDGFTMIGSPWLIRFSVGFPRPKNYVMGWDLAGVVEAIGKDVKRFKPGDEVFGNSNSTFAEFVAAKADDITGKPDNLSFEEAACVPTAALTALQGLRDKAKVEHGQRVLVNGASGGVGHFAIQVAKSMGAEVTGVCSGRNVDMVKSLGADHVFDYTKEDFVAGGVRYDVIFDNAASRKFSELRRALSPDGIIIPNSGHGGMSYVLKAAFLSLAMKRQGGLWITKTGSKDLDTLKELIEEGKVRPVIDRTYGLDEAPKAIGYVAEGHARGKVVISMVPGDR